MPLTPVESMAAESFIAFAPAVIAVTVLAVVAPAFADGDGRRVRRRGPRSGFATIVPLMLFAQRRGTHAVDSDGPLNHIVLMINFLPRWLGVP